VSEVNLREGDIANMGFAVEAGVPVVLVADIDRGGAIAALVGSHALQNDEERALLKGYIINKFRGDLELFSPAIDIIGARTGMACFGVLPWFHGASGLPADDSLALSSRAGELPRDGAEGRIRIRALTLSRVSNFDDFDPLAAEEDVDFAFVRPGDPIPCDADLVIIPGTKATLADLAFLRAQGWDVDIKAHVRRGGRVLGICGGYQMLGDEISDPLGVESAEYRNAPGLGLLPVKTVMGGEKTLRRFSALTEDGDAVGGYEIHMVVTQARSAPPMMTLDGRPEGARSPDGRIQGCYVHGLFTEDAYRARFLASFRTGRTGVEYGRIVDETLNELADHIGKNLDINAIADTAGL